MTQTSDAIELANLLKQQKKLANDIPKLNDHAKMIAIKQLKEIRNRCVELVDQHFRKYLEPTMAKKFPNKIYQGQAKPKAQSNVGVMVQFTQLLNDFFAQVLGNESSPCWKIETPIELRNYVTRSLSNKTISVIRRSKKQEKMDDDAVCNLFNDQLANDVSTRFSKHGIDPEEALSMIDQWDNGTDPLLQKYALVLRLYYIGDMQDSQVGDDLEKKFDLQNVSLPQTLAGIAETFDASISSVQRWKESALSELRKQIENEQNNQPVGATR